jgi:hypothetical protein
VDRLQHQIHDLERQADVLKKSGMASGKTQFMPGDVAEGDKEVGE